MNTIQLNDGKWFTKHYSKYESNLGIIHVDPQLTWESIDPRDLNLPNVGSMSVLYGDFFLSKKGTKCFQVKPITEAKHMLVRDSWGGPHNYHRYYGHTLPESNIYFYRSTSNGGGAGYDYSVLPLGWKNEVSIDEI